MTHAFRTIESAVPIPTRRQALEQVKRNGGSFPGICSECGCTENNACMIEGLVDEEPCWWANRERTLCSNPKCVTAAREKKNADHR